MATRAAWILTSLIAGQNAKETARLGWECSACGLLIGGAPVTGDPGPCPVCAAKAGKVVALVPDDSNRLSMLVLDRRLFALIDDYRLAKKAHERESMAHAKIGRLGNYDGDDDMTPSAETDASAAREQRSAIALADATIDSARGARTSRPSIH